MGVGEYQRPYAIRSVTGGIRFFLTYNPDFLEWLKGTVPVHARSYDEDDRSWYVSMDYANTVLARAANSFPGFTLHTGNYQREYYERAQERQRDRDWTRRNYQPPTPSSDHALLCVTPEAPPEVIRAAYKALAKLWHPDSPNGNHTKMQEANAAYERLRKQGKA